MGIERLLAAGLAALYAVTTAAATSTFTPLNPPAIPLTVRSPYLSAWLMGDTGGILPGSWPKFWTGGQIVGWQGFIRVDGVSYNWIGRALGPDPVNQTAFEYTSTQSIFTFDVAGKVTMKATFLSPVYPDDLFRQSQQFSYVQLSVQSSDGQAHEVQIYMDITGEWASPNDSDVINWTNGYTNGVGYHTFARSSPEVFTESSDMALWGDWYLATALNSGTTWRTGFADVETRDQFINDGKLDNGNDTNIRAISTSWPVFAYAQDFGTVSQAKQTILFAIGVAQNQVINFQGNTSGAESLAALWTTQYSTGDQVLADFYHDWAYAYEASTQLDSKITSDATAAEGSDYAALVSLSLRQAFGGLQVAHGTTQDYVFLKEISSDGDVQTVDVIFPAHPVLLYLNATLLKLMLDPIFENTESGHYPNSWAIHDLGFFPNAIGHPTGDDEAMPVEECGNMIIMTLAYAQRTGDNAYLSKHWSLLDQWAQYLVNDSIIPDYQLSTDDFAGKLANQTNLALKGIIGVAAIAEIANRTGQASEASSYRQTAEDYIARWQTYGIAADASPPHTTLQYGEDDTHGLLYNLYADRLLGLDLVPDSVYSMQSAYYPTINTKFGVPLDTRHTLAKGDWEVFAAAIAEADTRAQILSAVLTWVRETTFYVPLSDCYDTVTGLTGVGASGATNFKTRPVVGGNFAILALP